MCPVLQVVVDGKCQAFLDAEFEVIGSAVPGGRSIPMGMSVLNHESSAGSV